MKGDGRSEVAKLGLGVNVRIVDMNQERVRLSWLWGVRVGSIYGLTDYEMEACNGQL